MPLVDVIDLSGDDELEEQDVKPIKLEPNLGAVTMHQKRNSYASRVRHPTSENVITKQGSKEIGSLNELRSNSGTPTSILDLGTTLVDGARLPSPMTISPAPLCRQFWKAGNYNDIPAPRANYQNGKNYLKVHPMFLHSNATSHKWAFGAVAELLDNAIDEIQNGASFVAVDKITNPRNGNSALLFQDDGGGMSPEAMRRCMSFGFTDKKAKSAIGRYGNGFKTSTMRLGADVIVLTRHLVDSVMTQSAGLLSYTFLREMRYERIVVPMVHFQYNTYTGDLDFLNGREHFKSNLSLILKWSPYSTETELLKQFDDIGTHGTKVIIYNLWHTDDGSEELDYQTDPKDICIHGETKKADTRPGWNEVNEKHIGYRYRHSLRAYLSILYLRIPESFKIVLRGEVVERHNLADDLQVQHLKYILYKPQTGNGREAQVITTIGFLKEAPQVNLHGFNVYHKNRLILPFWQVVNYLDSRGRGVVGVLEANFVEPTHNKQEFEKTSLFQKLEVRLKEMTFEYWDIHCGFLGYQVKVKPKGGMTSLVSSSQVPAELRSNSHIVAPVGFGNATRKRSERPISVQGSHLNGKELGLEDTERAKRQGLVGSNVTKTGHGMTSQLGSTGNHRTDEEAIDVLNENKKLRLNCLEYEKEEAELELKVTRIKNEIKEMEDKYARLLSEFSAMNTAKQETA